MDANDQPCTQEDRDRIRAAALARAKVLVRLAEDLESAFWLSDGHWGLLDAASQLRQLAEG
jgi:hypothetical protein